MIEAVIKEHSSGTKPKKVRRTAEINNLMEERFAQIETDQNDLIHTRVAD